MYLLSRERSWWFIDIFSHFEMMMVHVFTTFALMARELTASISLTRQIAVYEQKDYKYFAKEAHNRSEPGWTVCQMEKLIEHQTNITVAIGEVIKLKHQVTNPPASLKVNMIYYFLEDNIDWDPHYIDRFSASLRKWGGNTNPLRAPNWTSEPLFAEYSHYDYHVGHRFGLCNT